MNLSLPIAEIAPHEQIEVCDCLETSLAASIASVLFAGRMDIGRFRRPGIRLKAEVSHS